MKSKTKEYLKNEIQNFLNPNKIGIVLINQIDHIRWHISVQN